MLNICNECDDMQIFKQNVFAYIWICAYTYRCIDVCVYIYVETIPFLSYCCLWSYTSNQI